MKKFCKNLAVLLVCTFVFTIIAAGCGSKASDGEITITDQDKKADKAETTAASSEVKKDDTAKANGEKKKIVIVQENENSYNIDKQKSILKALEVGGYINGKTAELTEVKMNGDEQQCQKTVDLIKQQKPDITVMNVERYFDKIVKPLQNSGIPIITESVETYGFENGKPIQNITGTKSLPDNIRAKAFEFLNKVAPIQGKKAIFVTAPGMFNKEDIQKNLKVINVELKDYVESSYFEDFKAAIEKYNSDSEVGWILIGLWPGSKKDKSSWSVVETSKWDISNRKKPTVTYWEVAVQMGMLCGLGVDLGTVGTQLGEMAVKVLNGEKIESIKAEDPRKVNIVLNQKRAQDLKIDFPAEILGSASKVFIDYEGHTTADVKK